MFHFEIMLKYVGHLTIYVALLAFDKRDTFYISSQNVLNGVW